MRAITACRGCGTFTSNKDCHGTCFVCIINTGLVRILKRKEIKPEQKAKPKYYEKTGYARLTPDEREARALERAMQGQMLRDMYRLAGLNSKGESFKQGWTDGGAGLTPLGMNPFLDQDYEAPSAPDRLTLDELKELL